MEIEIKGKKYKIEYSPRANYHVIGINDRPFNAIQSGTKKIEVRTNTPYSPFDYSSLQANDTIEFLNETTGEIFNVSVVRVTKYSSVRDLLEAEGTRNVLSSGGNLEQGIISINSLTGYKESIPIHGVYAVEVGRVR